MVSRGWTILLAALLVVTGLYLLVFGGAVQYCSACESPYCIANTGTIISCSQSQYFVSPFQTAISMEPLVAHWDYTLNILGLLVLVSGLFVYAKTTRGLRQKSSVDNPLPG